MNWEKQAMLKLCRLGAIVMLPTRDGKYLMQDDEENEGLRPPGGGKESKDKDLEATIVREIGEEFGLTAKVVKRKLKFLGYEYRKPFWGNAVFELKGHGLKPGTYQASNSPDEQVTLVESTLDHKDYIGPQPHKLITEEAKRIGDEQMKSAAKKPSLMQLMGRAKEANCPRCGVAEHEATKMNMSHRITCGACGEGADWQDWKFSKSAHVRTLSDSWEMEGPPDDATVDAMYARVRDELGGGLMGCETTPLAEASDYQLNADGNTPSCRHEPRRVAPRIPKAELITFEEPQTKTASLVMDLESLLSDTCKQASIAVDLDGTLALHDDDQPFDPEKIGKPVPIMRKRVRQWIRRGEDVVIFTARAADPKNIPPIKAWLKQHGMAECTITNEKTPDMKVFYDDRAVAVEKNEGVIKSAADKNHTPFWNMPKAWQDEFNAKEENVRKERAEKETDAKKKKALLTHHGKVVAGECGHTVRSCRCSAHNIAPVYVPMFCPTCVTQGVKKSSSGHRFFNEDELQAWGQSFDTPIRDVSELPAESGNDSETKSAAAVAKPSTLTPVSEIAGNIPAVAGNPLPTTGPEAIAYALSKVDLVAKENESQDIIRRKLKSKRPMAVKTLGFIQGFKRSGLKPSDLVIHSVPVIPPQFRPYTVAGDVFIPGDANELYRDLMNLTGLHGELEQTLGKAGAASNKLRVYDAAKALYGFGEPTSPKTRERGVSGFLQKVTGTSPKFSFIHRNLLSKNLDYVGRGVIGVDPDLGLDQIGIPEDMAWTLYAPHVQRRLVRGGMTPAEALKAVQDRSVLADRMLNAEMPDRPVMYSRAPAWHKFNALGGYAKRIKGHTIMINPLVTTGMNADFDGDTMNVHLPALPEAVDDVKHKLMPSRMLFSIKERGKVMPIPKQEAQLGLWTAQNRPHKKVHKFANSQLALAAIKAGHISLSDEVEIG